MKRTITAVIAVVLCLCTFLSLGPGAQAKTGDEVRAAKKVISVVYDDSGSMAGGKWINANYAVQALVAQLNSHDELYISYMKSPKNSDRSGLDNVEQAVKTIRNIPGGGTTPFQTVETAFNKLKSHKDKDFTTQYWLVVLTDGSFDNGENINQELRSFVGTQMSNESTLHVVYVGIGGAPDVTPDPAKGLYSYHAGTAKEIVGVMRDMANLVSGRIRVDDLEKIDDSTVRFSSKLPLYSFSVLSQNSAASVVKVESDEAELDISRNLALDASDVSRTISRHLKGNAAVVTLKANAKKNTVIPAGTYTIHFSEPVEFENVTVQYEPAIDMKAVLKKDGSAVTDTSQLGESDTVDIVVTPVVPGTDQVIPDADLPRDIKWTVEYENNGKTIASSKSRELKNVSLQLGSAILRGTMEIPGFVPVSYEIYLDIDKPLIVLGIMTDQPTGDSFPVYERAKLSDGPLGGKEVTFRITGNGVPLTKEELKDLKISLAVGDTKCDDSSQPGIIRKLGWFEVGINLKSDQDGVFTLKPKIPGFTAPYKAGDYTVTVYVTSDKSVTAEGQFTVEPGDWKGPLIKFLVVAAVVLVILLYGVWVYCFKKRFSGKYELGMRRYRIIQDEEGNTIANSIGLDSTKINGLSGRPVTRVFSTCSWFYFPEESGGIIDKSKKRAKNISEEKLIIYADENAVKVREETIAACYGRFSAITMKKNPGQSFNPKSILSQMKNTAVKSADGKVTVRAWNIDLTVHNVLFLQKKQDDDILTCIYLEKI